ncbi:MAG TPA: DNA alkylation repair protein [Paludibacteraceae bacterium]|nr:DNA alkylation repair protein [Paludibacteraceae bacterium]HQB69363.1 DNA alkylation repair protein [Paludibacteraceae bacterium]HRS67676.1 DNA alkylation repair protein [Paludibacteraceae bacterium]
MNIRKTYFVENKEITQQVNQIKRIIRGSMNGITVESMSEKGIQYKENFGVSLPRLREIASHYEPNMQLATQLWFLEIRESMIIASHLVPKNEMSTAVALSWCEKIPAYELAEITAMTLFSQLPNALQFIEATLDTTHIFVFMTAISTATRITQSLPESVIQSIVLNFNKFEQITLTEANILATFLTRVANDNSERIALIKEVIQTFHSSEDYYKKFIFEFVTKEIEFLKQI